MKLPNTIRSPYNYKPIPIILIHKKDHIVNLTVPPNIQHIPGVEYSPQQLQISPKKLFPQI